MKIFSTIFSLLISFNFVFSQGIGITNSYPFNIPLDDTTQSEYLPNYPKEIAGKHGFLLKTDDGNFKFEDGTPVKFFGTALSFGAAFPDSLSAINTAGHLRKLGINLVRFEYIDNIYSWGQSFSFLDVSSGRKLHEEQMKKLDWFIYQLKLNGIYTYLTLHSARALSPEDGVQYPDSALWLGQGVYQIYPQARSAHKLVSGLLLNHINKFTSIAYKDDPTIAMLEIMNQGSYSSLYKKQLVNYIKDGYSLSYHQSKRVDTLFSDFLRTKYGLTSGLKNAWKTDVPTGGFPNLSKEGGYEGEFEKYWNIFGSDATITPILSSSDSVPEGLLALQLRIRNSQGNIYGAYMAHVVDLKFDHIYKLTFKSKCSNPNGRDIIIQNSEASSDGLYAGTSTKVSITPYWKEHEVLMYLPIKPSVPIAIYFYFGDIDGDLKFDDMKIKEIEPVGLIDNETLENFNIGRINSQNRNLGLLSSKRIQDQSEFYNFLDKDYQADLMNHIKTYIGAKQLVTGMGSYWASDMNDVLKQKYTDFSQTTTFWDYINDDGTKWTIQNYSPLRYYGYATNLYDVSFKAHDKQPLMASVQQPFPNNYMSEMGLFLPSYALHQDWDGIVWNYYSQGLNDVTKDVIDSAQWNQNSKNPSFIAVLPAMANVFRNGLIKKSNNTIKIQQSESRVNLLARGSNYWGNFAIPGSFPGYTMAVNRIVIDSINAQNPSQINDIGFPPQTAGDAITDTREIDWEYGVGVLTVNTPFVQGASGLLSRSEGATTDNLNITMLTQNATSTVIWTGINPKQKLDTIGRSFLTISSRCEPTGWQWVDTNSAKGWGVAPMIMDVVKARLAVKVNSNVKAIRVLPLNEKGNKLSEPFYATKIGDEFRITIDQNQTKTTWFSLELQDNTNSIESEINTGGKYSLSASPNLIFDYSKITIDVPYFVKDATLDLINLLGEKVASIHNGSLNSGISEFQFDSHDFPSGNYIIKLVCENKKQIFQNIRIQK